MVLGFFFWDPLGPGFRTIYKIHLHFFFIYYFFSLHPGMVSKLWEKYFHMGFKVPGVTHFKPARIQRCFLHTRFQKLFYFKLVIVTFKKIKNYTKMWKKKKNLPTFYMFTISSHSNEPSNQNIYKHLQLWKSYSLISPLFIIKNL
jgi:hypothetical protein